MLFSFPDSVVATQDYHTITTDNHFLTLFNFIYSDIYLDGNHLECEGVIEMIKLLADKAEMEAIERAEKKERENAPPVNNVVSEVSQMSATSAAVNEDTPPEITESPRYM